MCDTIKIKTNTLVSILTVTTIIIVASVLEHVNVLFAVTMVVWGLLFIYSVVNIKRSPLLFCFMISFFVFLLGRQCCFHYLHQEQVYDFLDVVNDYTYVCLIVSFVGIMVGLLFYTEKPARFINVSERIYSVADFGNNQWSYQFATKIFFYICIAGGLAASIIQIRYVSSSGYLESYSAEIGTAGVPSVFSYPARFLPVAVCLFLGTKPPKRKALIPMLLYEGYAALRLLTGQRYPFIGISMLLLIYYILRSKQESGWIKPIHYVLLIISIPVLMLFLTVYDSIRRGAGFAVGNVLGTINDFLVQQGGSINVIRRTIFNADQLQDMHLVSFQGIYSSLFENGISRRLFNITTYEGNSIERALNTNNLAHRLSYIAYGTGYLSGKGTGSSYIAELLHDFGLIGVFIGSILYGVLLKKIDKIDFKHSLGDGIKLAMIYYLILSPRGGFDSFIGSVFNLQSLIGFAGIWLITVTLGEYGVIRNGTPDVGE